MSEKKIMSDIEKNAFNFEKTYGGCTQAVLYAFKKKYEFISDMLFKAGTGQAGGMGLTGNICGALTGASMVISAVRGRDFYDLEDKERIRYESLEMIRELTNKFNEEYGSTDCSEIQKKLMGDSFNLWDPVEKKAFLKAGGHSKICPQVCGKCALWTEIILKNRNLI